MISKGVVMSSGIQSITYSLVAVNISARRFPYFHHCMCTTLGSHLLPATKLMRSPLASLC